MSASHSHGGKERGDTQEKGWEQLSYLGAAVLPGSGEPTHASLRPQRQPGKAGSCCLAETSARRWRPPDLSSLAITLPRALASSSSRGRP